MRLCAFSALPNYRPLHRDGHDLLASTVIGTTPLRSWRKPLKVVLVKNRFQNGVRRTVVPTLVMILIKLDRRDGALADIRAAPSPCFSEKLRSDFEIRMLHALRHEVDAFELRNSHSRCSLLQEQNPSPFRAS